MTISWTACTSNCVVRYRVCVLRSKGSEHGFMQASFRGTCQASFLSGGGSGGSCCGVLGRWDAFPGY
jgi:hypothetical protein